jgi:hypothetical protein
MSGLRRARMLEDRHMRDSARALLDADFQNLRNDLSRRGLAERAIDRVKEGATEVYDEAVEVAADHKGALAALIAALVLWFARNPIASLLTEDDEAGEENDEAGARAER